MLRSALLPLVTSQTGNDVIVGLQQLCGVQSNSKVNLVWYSIFRAASALGEEIFSLMPALFWFGFPSVALPFATHFATLLIGQYLKDVLCLPRPDVKTTKIVRLETHFETEYGMPSTHTASGVLPLTVFLALKRNQPAVFALVPAWVGPSLCLLALAVGVSRLYMGVHSVADVTAGLGLGITSVVVLHHYGDVFDSFVYKSHSGLYFTLVSLYWFCAHYPATRPWSASWGTAAQIYGTWFGVALSSWAIFTYPQFHWVSARLVKSSSRWQPRLFLLELVVAAIVSGLAKVLGKLVAQSICLQLVQRGLVKPHPAETKDVLGRPVPPTKLYCVEVPTRIFSYAFLAFSVVCLVPAAWVYLGIDP